MTRFAEKKNYKNSSRVSQSVVKIIGDNSGVRFNYLYSITLFNFKPKLLTNNNKVLLMDNFFIM